MFPHFSYLLSAATLFPSPNEPIIISTVHISITFHLHVYTPNFQIPIIHHLFSAHVYHHTHSSFTYPSHYPYNSPLSLHFPYLFYQPLTNPFPLSSTMPSLSNHHTHFLPTCMEPCTRTLHTTHNHPSCISIAFILVPFSIPISMQAQPSFLFPLPINILTPVSIYTRFIHTSHSFLPSLTNSLYPSHYFMIQVPILMQAKSHVIPVFLAHPSPPLLSVSSYPPSLRPLYA